MAEIALTEVAEAETENSPNFLSVNNWLIQSGNVAMFTFAFLSLLCLLVHTDPLEMHKMSWHFGHTVYLIILLCQERFECNRWVRYCKQSAVQSSCSEWQMWSKFCGFSNSPVRFRNCLCSLTISSTLRLK